MSEKVSLGELVQAAMVLAAADSRKPEAELDKPIGYLSKQTWRELAAVEAEAKAKGAKLRVMVLADNSGVYCGNGLRFDSGEDAVTYGKDLSGRWMAVRDWKVELATPDDSVESVD